jgi:hypothetical protein
MLLVLLTYHETEVVLNVAGNAARLGQARCARSFYACVVHARMLHSHEAMIADE